ncbi:MAG: DUF3667 domain-containing protein [Chitinophagaceae bacterium]|nr:DUF3667 domain-containing protein [Chitinophagaceae bacterium]
MSHLTERKEKVCLNCQATVYGRYCHVCGQENIEPKESFWHLLTHFAYDVTHFDGKFFSTLRYLLFKPGFLSHEYLRGRRASYLHPIRMYVFTSAFFFLIFFTVKNEEGIVKTTSRQPTAAEIIKALEKAQVKYKKRVADSALAVSLPMIRQTQLEIDSDLALIRRDTTSKTKLKTVSNNNFNFMGGTRGGEYKSLASYDSAQAKLPAGDRDNFLQRKLIRQNLHLKEKYNNDKDAMWKAIIEKFNHLFPQMLFVSLPLLALALKLLYVRRKNFYYVNHVIFTIHLYCGTFIIILAGMAIEGLFEAAHLNEPSWIKAILVLSGFFYWYKSMRYFYEQRRGKTILKYLLLLFLGLLIMTLIFAIFFIFSAMSI